MQRLLNPIYCRRSDCRIRGCNYFSKTIIDWWKPGYASLPACSLGRRRIRESMGGLPRLHAGSDAYQGVSRFMRRIQI